MEDKISVSQAAIKNGMIVGLIGILVNTVNYMFALYEGTFGQIAISVISVLITILFIISSHRTFKAANNGYMSYGQGLGIGTILALVSSAISGIYQAIYIAFIDDSSIAYQMEKSAQDMAERGMDQAQIEQAMGFSEMFMSPVAMIIMALIVGTFFGFILSLIISAFTKEADPSLEI